jgi:hypothetical protein
MQNNLMEASRQWATRPSDQRFETLESLRASVHSRRLRSRSVDLDIPAIEVAQKGETLAINSAIAPCEPSHWAFGQFAGMLGAPANYLRKLPVNLAVDCLNAGLKSQPRDSMKFMTIASEDGGLNTLQAVTSTTYGRIWDADCVDAVGRIVERTNGKFYNPKAYDIHSGEAKPSGLYASDRDVFMFMIDGGSQLDIGPRAKLNRGFFVWNSETGAKTFGLMTFLFNTVCGNHIVWGAQNVNKLIIRHTKGGPYRFDSEAAPQLLAYANSSAVQEEETIRAAMVKALPAPDAFDSWISPFGFTKGEINNAIETAKREEGQCATVWDLVQGFTAYARGFDYVDARVDLERRAGALLKTVA